MKRRILDEALFKKENKVLNKFKTFGKYIRAVWGYILCIFLIGVAIYTPFSCCSKYIKMYDSYVNSYADTINKTYPVTQILEYTITGTVSSDIHNYSVWVKGKNGNMYNLTIPKSKCIVHMTNDSVGKCIVILHKYKGLLAYYDAHRHDSGCKENGTYTFIATDKYGNSTTKVIIVDKIDKESPIITDVTVENRTITIEAIDTIDSIAYRSDRVIASIEL